MCIKQNIKLMNVFRESLLVFVFLGLAMHDVERLFEARVLLLI